MVLAKLKQEAEEELLGRSAEEVACAVAAHWRRTCLALRFLLSAMRASQHTELGLVEKASHAVVRNSDKDHSHYRLHRVEADLMEGWEVVHGARLLISEISK